jgi:hypothetical protein
MTLTDLCPICAVRVKDHSGELAIARCKRIAESGINYNCCGAGPHTPGEVRVMPSGGDSNLILCLSCWTRENQYRRNRNRELGTFAQYRIPSWESAKVYDGGE